MKILSSDKVLGYCDEDLLLKEAGKFDLDKNLIPEKGSYRSTFLDYKLFLGSLKVLACGGIHERAGALAPINCPYFKGNLPCLHSRQVGGGSQPGSEALVDWEKFIFVTAFFLNSQENKLPLGPAEINQESRDLFDAFARKNLKMRKDNSAVENFQLEEGHHNMEYYVIPVKLAFEAFWEKQVVLQKGVRNSVAKI